MDEPLSVLSQVTSVLEELGIRSVLVGSFASSLHGLYRSTADIDTQWTDGVGILGTNRDRLDSKYLSHWADRLGASDLLDKALREAE